MREAGPETADRARYQKVSLIAPVSNGRNPVVDGVALWTLLEHRFVG